MTRFHRGRRFSAFIAILLMVGLVPTVAAAAPSNQGCESRNLNTTKKLLECVDADDAFEHLEALQDIADANGGTRASGTPGYDQSADYVANLLEDAGFTVERQVFDFSLYTENSSSLTADDVCHRHPDDAVLRIRHRHRRQRDSRGPRPGAGQQLDVGLRGDRLRRTGLVRYQRHRPDPARCVRLRHKAINATNAGAEAAIIFNQGNTADPGRQDIIGGTLGEGVVGIVDIPVLDTSYSDGLVVLDATDVDLAADTTIVTNTTENVIGDLPGNNPDNVVMAGAHLDSVAREGPGIQDNGSGSAALLAIALELANNKKYTPQNTLRFAWWGAEESGLIGSTEYVFNPDFGLTQEEYDALAAYLNFDMVASPNFIYGVYDADESTFPAPVARATRFGGPRGPLRGVLHRSRAFRMRTRSSRVVPTTRRSSTSVSRPVVCSPARKASRPPSKQAIWGGTAGDQYDPCYHLACDTIDNPSAEALDVNVDAIAYAIFNLAASTEAVNGVAGTRGEGHHARTRSCSTDLRARSWAGAVQRRRQRLRRRLTT